MRGTLVFVILLLAAACGSAPQSPSSAQQKMNDLFKTHFYLRDANETWLPADQIEKRIASERGFSRTGLGSSNTEFQDFLKDWMGPKYGPNQGVQSLLLYARVGGEKNEFDIIYEPVQHTDDGLVLMARDGQLLEIYDRFEHFMPYDDFQFYLWGLEASGHIQVLSSKNLNVSSFRFLNTEIGRFRFEEKFARDNDIDDSACFFDVNNSCGVSLNFKGEGFIRWDIPVVNFTKIIEQRSTTLAEGDRPTTPHCSKPITSVFGARFQYNFIETPVPNYKGLFSAHYGNWDNSVIWFECLSFQGYLTNKG